MRGFRKSLVIYIALVVTLLAALLLYQTRKTAENTQKVISSTNKIERDLEKLAQYQESSKQILEKLETLKKESENQNQPFLGQTQQASANPQVALGFLTINDKKTQSADVYESKSMLSKSIGKAEFGKAYRYLKKEDNWYQIILPKTESIGWVSSKFFKELSDNVP